VATPVQGDVFWYESEDDRRPVLVVTRSQAIPVLEWLVVAPVTSRIRNIQTEIRLGPANGMRNECVAVFDTLRNVRKAHLTELLGSLGPRRDEICRALAALADC
jgi:mRNA interferase MazF